MKSFSFLAFLLVFGLLSSSRSEDAEDKSEYGSGGDADDYVSSGDEHPEEEGEEEMDNLETSNPEGEDEIQVEQGGRTYAGREDEVEEEDTNNIEIGFGDHANPGAEVKARENLEDENAEFSIRHPAVLALIIGGIIFVLLILLLLVMFLVYRLRKKDEGSYALDENMKKKSRNIIYTKPPTTQDEFFA